MSEKKIIKHCMKIATSSLPATSKEGVRNIKMEDAEGIGRLMYGAYKGTIDYKGETPEQSIDEVTGTLTGKYGLFLDFASFVIKDESGIKSAAKLITARKSSLNV